jgi:hypothetical protein
LQWQHDAADPHVVLPQTLPGSFWHVPLTTHVYCDGHVPHDPPQPLSPHTIDPQNGMHCATHCPCELHWSLPAHAPHDPPQPSLPH